MRISGFSPVSSLRSEAFPDDGTPAMDVLQEHCRLMLCRAAVSRCVSLLSPPD
jgi:hypothetical protein